MEVERDSMGVSVHTQIDSDDDDDDCPSSPESTSFDDGGLMAAAMEHDVTAQLAAAGWQNIYGTLLFASFIIYVFSFPILFAPWTHLFSVNGVIVCKVVEPWLPQAILLLSSALRCINVLYKSIFCI